MPEARQPRPVARQTAAAAVPVDRPGQMPVPLHDRQAPVAFAPVPDRPEGAGEAVLGRDLPHSRMTPPRPTPDVGEAKEVKPVPSVVPRAGPAPEVH